MCRKLSRRCGSLTFSFDRSIDVSSISVTPTGALAAPGNGLAPTLSTGHSPAWTDVMATSDSKPTSRAEWAARVRLRFNVDIEVSPKVNEWQEFPVRQVWSTTWL